MRIGGVCAFIAQGRAGERKKCAFERVGCGLLLQFRGRPLGDNRAVVDDGDPVSHPFRFIHVMGSKKNSSALGFVQVLHMIPEQVAALWVEAERRLIEEEDARCVQQTAGNFKPALHAAGKALYITIPAVP